MPRLLFPFDRAVLERVSADRYASGDRDIFKPGAPCERFFAEIFYAVLDMDAFQISAHEESIAADRLDAPRDRQVQESAAGKGEGADRVHA